MDLVPLGFLAEDVGVCGAELSLVKRFSKAFFTLCNLLFYLLLNLAQVVLYKDIGTISFLGILIVDKGIVEGSYMAGGLPDAGMHEYGGVYTHDILIETCHGFPPISFDVVFELYTHLAVVVNGCKAIVNLAGREYETILLAMGYKHFE